MLLASCATVHDYARLSFAGRAVAFHGPRAITLTGSDEDVAALERALVARGFEVSRVDAVIDRLAPAPPHTRYVADISGLCGFGGFAPPTLMVDVIDTETRQHAAEIHLYEVGGCPETFFEEAAREMDSAWER